MKTSASFLILLLVGFHFNAKSISLADAIKQKQVSARLRTYDYSNDSVYHASFYGECIMVELTNLMNLPLNIELESGRFLMPDDSSLQRMMVMQAVNVSLKPKEKKQWGVQAMCTELHDGSPKYNTIFSVGKMASGNLLKVAKFIDENKYQSDAGQQAVWALSDKADPAGIYSDDTAQAKNLRKFVCGLLNIPVPAYRANLGDAYDGRFRQIHGTFEYIIHEPRTIKLEVFNEQGQLLKRCVDNKHQAAGDYHCEYDFSVPVNNPSHVDRMIIVKYYIDGKLIASSPHKIPNN